MGDGAGDSSTAGQAIRLKDYAPPSHRVEQVELAFDLDEHATLVRARLHLTRDPAAGPATLHLDGEALELVALRLDGQALAADRFRVTEAGLEIDGVPDRAVLEVETRIDPAANTELSGLYLSNGGFFTQCEAEGFRRITYFPDRPDVMARYTVTVTADRARCPVLLSNGNPVAAGEHPDGRHWARWDDPHPKPCYLFALVAGDLVSVADRFTTRSGRDVGLGIWVRRGDEDRCAHAMRVLKASMRWDEEAFGLEYDLDVFNIAAVADFNMGAMENKGLNIFNTKYVLARPETATDADHQGIETVVSHEYFHNWTGNRVTCRDWFQLSLKEGLTVFRDQQFTASQGSAAVRRIGDVRNLRARQFPEDAGPLAHPVRPDSYVKIDNFYTATVYQKGAEVVRMLHTLIGPANFRRGMDLYIARHDNSAATIEDFVSAMAEAGRIDLGQFLRWYDQAGTPEIEIRERHDPATRRYELTLRQSTPPTPRQPGKRPLHIPVAMGLLDGDGQTLPTRLAGEAEARRGTRLLHLTGAEQIFVFEDVATPPVPSLLRGFSAPVRLRGLRPDQLQVLAAHDTDPFVRWDSGQRYATGVLLDLAAAWRRHEALRLDPGLVDAARATLRAADRDPAFAVEALRLPGETVLADAMEVADVEAIHAARTHACAELGRQLGPELRDLYDRIAASGEEGIDGKSIGRRALKNACLALLGAAQGAGIAWLARAQFEGRRNMTDVLAALAVLCETEAQEREAALAAFHARWRDDDLVLDKWFAIQAASHVTGTPIRVEALLRHPDFDLANPNRARALIAAFATANPSQFHAGSGDGYRILADAVIALDRVNSQVAARQVHPLGAWRRHPASRGALMRRELGRILAAPGLSAATREIAERSLA